MSSSMQILWGEVVSGLIFRYLNDLEPPEQLGQSRGPVPLMIPSKVVLRGHL